MLKNLIVAGLLGVFVYSCSNSYDNLVRTYDAPRRLIWKAMVRVLAAEYTSFDKVLVHPPTLITKPLMVDKEFGVDKTAYVATVRLTGFTRPYAVDVVVKKYPDLLGNPSVYTVDLDKGAKILAGIEKFIEQERFNFSIKDQFTPY